MPNILDRDNKIARTSLLGSPSYCTLPLPDYFDFSDILSKVSKHLADNPLHPDTKKNKKASTDNDEKPSVRSIESPNHTIYANKDGHYAWRPLTLINPVLYVNLVHTLTEKKNWDTIRTRFQDLQKDPRIECLSIPNPLDKASLQHEAAIRDYWKYFEQRSIELSAEYEYLASTDITDCYGSIYTHSVAWALHGKKEAKEQRCNQSLLGNKIDRMLQDMNNGQTNGIPQGNMVSDLIAELILAYGDHLLTERIGPNGSSNIDPDWRILRYRDDFRIFTHSKKQAHNLLLELMIVLQGLNLKLNSSKTYISSDTLTHSTKPDKLALIARNILLLPYQQKT